MRIESQDQIHTHHAFTERKKINHHCEKKSKEFGTSKFF